MAVALVLDVVDGAEHLCDRDVEDEVGEGEERDGDPTVASWRHWRRCWWWWVS